MPKINREEYEVLKELDDKWKWIARDKDRGLYAFTEKPVRKYDPSPYWDTETEWPYAAFESLDEIHLFQFIQWEDEEPYSIQGLIEEYESEETEVKSKQELIEEWESAIEAAEFYGKGKEERLISYMRDFVDDLNQLDEPEVLTQEWIDNHTDKFVSSLDLRFVSTKDLQNLLVPKQGEVKEGRVRLIVGFDGGTDSYYATDVEDALDFLTDYDARFTVNKEPSIPQFVAEWIESRKNNYPFDVIGAYLRMNEPFANEQTREVLSWIHESELNRDSFARAWLDGYTVEKEQKYYVLDKEGHLLIRGFSDGTVGRVGDRMKPDLYPDWNKKNLPLTEQEIKDYDERFWPFAVKVEELEE